MHKLLTRSGFWSLTFSVQRYITVLHKQHKQKTKCKQNEMRRALRARRTPFLDSAANSPRYVKAGNRFRAFRKAFDTNQTMITKASKCRSQCHHFYKFCTFACLHFWMYFTCLQLCIFGFLHVCIFGFLLHFCSFTFLQLCIFAVLQFFIFAFSLKRQSNFDLNNNVE